MKKTTLSLFCSLLLLMACATFKEQHQEESTAASGQKITNTVYLAGGFGEKSTGNGHLQELSDIIKKAPENTSVLFLGDNVSASADSIADKTILKEQVAAVKEYQRKTYFIPGENEWKYRDNRKNNAIQDFLMEQTGDAKIFLPKKGGPLSSVSLGDNLEIIFIDSQWYISDWDKIKYINEYSPDIKTRRRFLEELEGMIRDAEFKNIIIAMHHPLFSNGKHGGKYSFNDYMKPLPIAGSVDKAVRKLGGTNPQDVAYSRYRELTSFVTALAKLSDHITIVSAHEGNLQYLEGGKIHQIISGSLSESEATKLAKGTITAVGGKLNYQGVFTSSEYGYAKLNYYEDGSSAVEFHSFNQDKLLYRHELTKPLPIIEKPLTTHEKTVFPDVVQAQILTNEETSKSGFYRLLWGEHYRKAYSKPVTVKTALLDTLYGGLTIVKEGGGHQSQSLRVVGKDGRQYVMRSLRKDAVKFLRFKLKGLAFDPEAYEDTAAEELVSDFFTTAHPYAQLAVSDIADAAQINHSNIKLYYFPKQQGFGNLNEKYGDGLYYIEERASKEQKNFKGYQYASAESKGPITDFTGTTEVIENLRKSDKYTIDKRQYIRSRIFDMLIGDWDRHEDQWRWALHENGSKGGIYAPIPRDRDASFSKFGGIAFSSIKRILPETRFWQTYDDDLKDVKWFNSEAYNLDKLFISPYDEAVWIDEARSIQQSLSSETIDRAFLKLPVELQDQDLEVIKTKLKNRLKNLDKIAQEYAHFISNKVVIHGTDKKDIFHISRQTEGNTTITISTEENSNMPYYTATINSHQSCEVWLYGLNGDDEFIVDGDGEQENLIRMIGGYGTDHYKIHNNKKARIYDYDYEQQIIDDDKPSKKQLSSLYETNNLHFRYFIPSNNVLLPVIGFVTDDGLFLGLKDKYTYNDFNGNPHKQIHQLFANYYFMYQSAEAGYSGTFFNIFPNINFVAEAYFSGAKFSNNFFGYGNETINEDQTLGKDYNRARTRQTNLSAGLEYRKFKIKGLFESYEIEEMDDRYFNSTNFAPSVFEHQNYLGAEASLLYKNRDAEDFPTQGLYAETKAGWKFNTANSDNNFGYILAKLGLTDKLVSSGNLVFQTTVEGRVIFGDNYNFYHASSLGGNHGLRGYRNERFSGKSSLYDSSNLILKITSFKTGLLPVDFGIYGGFDFGRVWIEDDPSRKWHTSQGGGIWFGGLNTLSLQAAYFNSAEGNILFIGLNFKY
ncbi:hypothetical protein [Flavobacterium sp. N1736]|uniref:hypothetical protein n=1 Tax=Flavobacterium sp. N1736 TaxID=2986823 RepID=UPI0022248D2E|nr:hypothetical protein [Flavobacterium sp. N1736]